MTTIALEQTQTTLAELIHRLMPGEEVVITENDQIIARLVSTPRPARKLRQLGSMKGTVLYMTPDFDAPLEDFKEYME
ncbi:MAG TPA: type II toxin-antitoxin system prevent-host-death family antitoxin [Gammaproteobacteria bacterium]|nr:type II toxin-antitoxin system prevent-host-death family antitoxin [Gammaproteobacteria bacterium]